MSPWMKCFAAAVSSRLDMPRILVIDDEEMFRQATSLALQRKGFETLEAMDGIEGADKARAQLPDLIICDVNMDRMDGYALLEKLRQEPSTAAIPFILMTGMGDANSMRRGMNLGADDYLSKPFTAPQLFSAVEARLKKSQMLRQTAEKKLSDLRANLSLALPHEMITPLNGIFGLAQILSSDAQSLSATEVADFGTSILQSAERLHRTVQNFLLFGQLEIQSTDTDSLSELRRRETGQAQVLIEGRARRLAQKMGRSADIQTDVVDTTICVGQDLLTKLVDELVDNALKFSSAGRAVQISGQIREACYLLVISDNGLGMTGEQIAAVGAYTQFNRKAREQQGSGLGLAIARRIAEIHGGLLSIQSEPNCGTSVTVRLPLALARN